EEKDKKKAQAAVLKKHRSRLRKICAAAPFSGWISADDVETLCLRLDYGDMNALMERLAPPAKAGGGPAETQGRVAAAKAAVSAEVEKLRAWEKAERERLKEEEARKRLAERQKLEELKSRREWSLEEISLLAKAIAKYQGASATRWELITAMVNTL